MRVTSARGLLVTLKGSIKAVECASWRGEGRGGRDKGKRGREDKREGSKKEEKGKVKAKGKRRKEGKRERLEKEETGRKARSFQRSGAGYLSCQDRLQCKFPRNTKLSWVTEWLSFIPLSTSMCSPYALLKSGGLLIFIHAECSWLLSGACSQLVTGPAARNTGWGPRPIRCTVSSSLLF